MNDNFPLFILDFLSYMETIKNKSPNTICAYSSHIKQFVAHICYLKFQNVSPKHIKSITAQDLESLTLIDFYNYFIDMKKENNIQNTTLKHKIACIRSLYNFLHMKAKLISTNITKDLEYPKIQKSLPLYLTLDECIKLLSVIDGKYYERDYAIISVFLNCGLRVSELVNLKIFDIKEDYIRVLGKGNIERFVPLNNHVKQALDIYLQKRLKVKQTNDILFINYKKSQLHTNAVRLLVKKYLKMADLNPLISPHKLRHSAATLMLQNEVDILSIKNILGHQSIATTEVYTHIDNDLLRQAIQSNPLNSERRKS